MRPLIILSAAAVCAFAPRAAAAQMFLGFGGLEARAGVADPKNGGHSATVEADLGYMGLPALRATLGIDFFGSELDRVISGQQVSGTMKGAGGVAGLRYDIYPQRRFTLHVLGGVTVHSIRAQPDNPAVKDSLGGGHVGLQLGGGVSLRMGSGHFWSATADVRRVTERDAERTLVAFGRRYSLRGRRMYDRDAVPALRPKESSALPGFTQR
jgi:hypothetical protein